MTPTRNSDGFAELRKLGDDVPENGRPRKGSRESAAGCRHRGANERPRRKRPLKRWGAVAAAIVAVAVTTLSSFVEAAGLPRPSRRCCDSAAVASTQPPPSVPAGPSCTRSPGCGQPHSISNIQTGETNTDTVEIVRETWAAADSDPGSILAARLCWSRAKPRGSRGTGRTSGSRTWTRFPTEPRALLDATMGPG